MQVVQVESVIDPYLALCRMEPPSSDSRRRVAVDLFKSMAFKQLDHGFFGV